MRYIRPVVLVLLTLCITPVVTLAQGDACPAIVETALDAVDQFCQEAGRNQACYGSVSMQAEPQPGVSDFVFEQSGDIVDVAEIQTLRLSAMEEGAGVWGVALMQLQANIPDSVPGQNVTFLIFGDVQITNAVPENDSDYNPMQAFYLSTGIGDASCDEAPESGVLVQTPEGVGEVACNVDGVDVAMGSTVLFQAEAGNEMRVNAIEGSAVLNFDGVLHAVIAGTRLRVALGEDLLPSARPHLLEAYEAGDFRAMPLRLFRRRIEIADSPRADELRRLREMVRSGENPCGFAGLPRCEMLEAILDGADSCIDRSPVGGRRGNRDRRLEDILPFCGEEETPPEDSP